MLFVIVVVIVVDENVVVVKVFRVNPFQKILLCIEKILKKYKRKINSLNCNSSMYLSLIIQHYILM